MNKCECVTFLFLTCMFLYVYADRLSMSKTTSTIQYTTFDFKCTTIT